MGGNRFDGGFASATHVRSARLGGEKKSKTKKKQTKKKANSHSVFSEGSESKEVNGSLPPRRGDREQRESMSVLRYGGREPRREKCSGEVRLAAFWRGKKKNLERKYDWKSAAGSKCSLYSYT